jgi:hypothetical protein
LPVFAQAMMMKTREKKERFFVSWYMIVRDIAEGFDDFDESNIVFLN